ncbi:MAG: hypothetical protein NTZ93_04675 [Candidatus Beckwithbacteria bacterium]|nr:hypothetical protein [Candidatus Beckwithbacteria bacterium]
MKYKIVSAKPKEKLDVAKLIKYPKDFHGSTKVDHLVKFGDSFVSLIGKSEADLPKDGVVILEHDFDEARKLMDKINELAQQVISDATKYDDVGFCREYFNLAQAGYRMLDKYKPVGIPVSLERAGLVTTRLVLGVDRDAVIENEQRVVTKRTHLVAEPDTNLSVTVQWRDIPKLKQISSREILLSDFVNPASGASGLAFIVAAQAKGLAVAKINHRSISCTRQGLIFTRKTLADMGIKSSFTSVGEANELNEMYYLTGQRAVADAGHLLRHFLPKWYKQ